MIDKETQNPMLAAWEASARNTPMTFDRAMARVCAGGFSPDPFERGRQMRRVYDLVDPTHALRQRSAGAVSRAALLSAARQRTIAEARP